LRLVLLSHRLSRDTPLYPGTPPVQLKRVRSIEGGDSSNLWFIGLSSHSGTHVDAPNHFYPRGRRISQYSVDELVFPDAHLLDVPKGPGGVITPEDLDPYMGVIRRSSLILLRTGLQAYRSIDPVAYSSRGVLLSPSAARLLREEASGLRGLGVDAVSVSSPLRRAEGRETHRILLSDDRFVVIEDMDLEGKPSSYRLVIVAPLMVDEVDSAPCTVIGVLD